MKERKHSCRKLQEILNPWLQELSSPLFSIGFSFLISLRMLRIVFWKFWGCSRCVWVNGGFSRYHSSKQDYETTYSSAVSRFPVSQRQTASAVALAHCHFASPPSNTATLTFYHVIFPLQQQCLVWPNSNSFHRLSPETSTKYKNNINNINKH